MTANCERHPFEFSEGLCGRCGYDFCQDCLVFVRGPAKPPMCISCALEAAGVRSNGAPTPKYSRREMKRLTRERRAPAAPALTPAMLEDIAIDALPEFIVPDEPLPERTRNPRWTPSTFGPTAFTPGS